MITWNPDKIGGKNIILQISCTKHTERLHINIYIKAILYEWIISRAFKVWKLILIANKSWQKL